MHQHFRESSSRNPDAPDQGYEKISIIVLTHNRRRLLTDCLDSLLLQGYPREKTEILVIDDGSKDGTQEMVRVLLSRHGHLKYMYQNHRGISAARNTGIRNASGDILAIVADDYILEPSYAETVMTFFRQTPAAKVVRFKLVPSRSDLASRISHFYFDVSVWRRLYEGSAPQPQSWKEKLKRFLQKMPPLEEKTTTQHDLEAAGAAAFKRGVFSQAGLFDESLQRAEDTDMTTRLHSLGILVYYFPHHHVKHQYNPFLMDSLYKCFLTGFNRYKYYQKHPPLADRHQSVIKKLFLIKLGLILGAFWKSWQTRSVGQFLLYLPFMFLFEAANKCGFLSSWLLSAVKSKRTS